MEIKREEHPWSFADMANPFGVDHGDTGGVPPQGGVPLLAIHKQAPEQKAVINGPENYPLGKPTSPVVMKELSKKAKP